jgi:hypothetical protein
MAWGAWEYYSDYGRRIFQRESVKSGGDTFHDQEKSKSRACLQACAAYQGPNALE